MAGEDLTDWSEQFLAFHDRFAPYFYRAEVRERSRAYLQALLDRVERKNGWQLAEAMGEADPNGAQRLLYAARWDADAVRDELQRFVTETFGHPDGVLVVDESGVPKKGEKSVGVARQYCGAVGKVDNCQVGVFLLYASPLGHAFLDRRLFLPQEWAEDPLRRREAKVPAAIRFASKPQLATAMLAHALALGCPARWVTGDEVYGSAPGLRAALEERPCGYVLGVRRTEPLLVPPPVPKPRLIGLTATAAGVAAKLRPEDWQPRSAGAGSKGERWYAWARVALAEPAPAGWQQWLLLRRSLEDGDLAFYRSFAPLGTSLEELVRVAGMRWTIEQGLAEAKGEAGLDQYEVRHWQSWHRHSTLALLAHAFLAAVRQHAGAARSGSPPGGGKRPVAFSSWRRRRGGAPECAGGAQALGVGPALATLLTQLPAAVVPLAATAPSARPPGSLPLPATARWI